VLIGRLVSVDEVREEIAVQDDEVNEWASDNSNIFLPLEDDIQLKAREILLSHPTLVDTKKKKGSADPFLIAAACLYGGSVVTEEKPSGGPHREKIPDVCRTLGVSCITVLEMLQAEQLGSL